MAIPSLHITGYPAIYKTRFEELGYWHLPGTPSLWQCVDLTGDKPAQVGTQYHSKAELLANLEAYATEYGCEGANPRHVPMPWCERCQCWHHTTAEHIRRDNPDRDLAFDLIRQWIPGASPDMGSDLRQALQLLGAGEEMSHAKTRV